MSKTQSTFPTTLDTTLQTDRAFGDIITSDSYDIIEDAIYELEKKVGIDNSSDTSSLDYKIRNIPESSLSLSDVTTNNANTSRHGFMPKLSGNSNVYFNGGGTQTAVTDAQLSTSDITTNNASTSKHGFMPKLSGNSNVYFNGNGGQTAVTDAQLSLSDITTNDVNTSRHGFCPKATGNTSHFLRGDGSWATIQIPLVGSNFQSFANVIFGNGSDGDVTISSNTTLPAGTGGIQVRQYNNLTVNSGVFLEGNSADRVLVILVKETLTINGTIRMNGRGGAGGAANNPGGAGASGGGGGGGVAGYAGGGGGGNGAAGGGYMGGGGTNIYSGQFDQGGPVRGAGGSSPEAGVGGAGATYFAPMRTPWPFEIARTLWGAGGGGGSGGGAGGAGGGVLWIEANNIVWGGSGVISANGVAGSAGGSGGGGGGGAGGVVQVVFRTKSGTANIQASGGSGGTGSYAGGSGAVGLTGEFQLA